MQKVKLSLTKSTQQHFKTLFSDPVYRMESGLCAGEGLKLYESAIEFGVPVKSVCLLNGQDFPGTSFDNVDNVYEVSSKEMLSLTSTKSAPKILCEFEFEIPILETLNAPIVLGINISDPGNVGTIIRSCEAFSDFQYVSFGPSHVDLTNSKVLRASTGLIFRNNPMHLDSLELLKNKRVVLLDGNASQTINEYDFSDTDAICFGSEAHGFKGTDIEAFNPDQVSISMNPHVDSLNVSIAASLTLAAISGRT